MNEYPEWQKEIRAAQMAVNAEKNAKMRESMIASFNEYAPKLIEIGFIHMPDKCPDDGKWMLGDYRFFFDNDSLNIEKDIVFENGKEWTSRQWIVMYRNIELADIADKIDEIEKSIEREKQWNSEVAQPDQLAQRLLDAIYEIVQDCLDNQ